MNPSSEIIGNPFSLLIERVFWLGIGFFLVATIVNAIIGSRINKHGNYRMETKIKEIAQKAVEEND